MSIPKPSYTFTIPSIQDNTLLDCRIYHSPFKQEKHSTPTAVKAAIVAHPYAPLGGSQDDPVVSVISSVLLKHGYLVGTFNFRGASGSAGRTSWSARPELSDYVSFYGFMLAYLNGLSLPEPPLDGIVPPTDNCTLILGGYSYGSLIAKNLPPLQVVEEMFASPFAGSAQAEIILRAKDLSKDHVDQQQSVKRSIRGRNSLRASASLVVGGNESGATGKRASRESSRRSLDLEGVRKSVERMRKRSSRRVSGKHDSGDSNQHEIRQAFAITPRICYLLVSPLLAPITSFLSMSSKLKLPAALTKGTGDTCSADQLMLHPSCCIFGHQDIFTSHKRLQKWAAKHQKESETLFSWFSVEQAGHFWQEEGADLHLKDAIEQWLREFLDTTHKFQ